MSKKVSHSVVILVLTLFLVAPYIFEEIDPYLALLVSGASIVNVVKTVNKLNKLN